MGTLQNKLAYLLSTKNRFFSAMTGLGYNVSGMTFRQAVDLLYQQSFDEIINNFDVSEIDSAYQQNTKDALRQVLTLGEEYVHFLVITDMHMMNAQYTGYRTQVKPIADALMGTGKFDKVINLGDVLNHGDLEWVQKAKEWGYLYEPENGKCLFVMGNHDYEDGCVAHFKSEVFDYIAQYPNVTVDENAANNNAYYYDIPSHKLRLLMVDSNSQSYSNGIRSSFFINAINNLPEGWKFATFSHHGTTSEAQVLKLQFERYRDYYVADFRGHDHRDAVSRAYGYIFNTIFAAGYFTTLSINPQTGDVRYYRIGQMRPSFTFGAPDANLDESAIYGGRNGNSYGFTFRANDIPARFLGAYRNTAMTFAESPLPFFDTTVYSKSLETAKTIWAYKADKTVPGTGFNSKFGFWNYSGDTYETGSVGGKWSTPNYSSKLKSFSIPANKKKYQLFYPEDVLLSDSFPAGFNEALDNSAWQLGTFAQNGGINSASVQKVNPEGIIVKPNTTYRFTQPAGNPIGTLEYMTVYANRTQGRTRKANITDNYVEITTSATAWMIRLGVTTPAEDMSTCTFEEVTS